MSLEIRESQSQPAQSSWIPSVKTLAWGTLALGTIAAVGALCYTMSFPGAEGADPSPRMIDQLTRTPNLCDDASSFSSLCEDNLGYARIQMPQLNSTTLAQFLGEIRAQGISTAEEIVDPSFLTPVQGELGGENIAGMISSWMKGVWDPCKDRILSADGYVIDGHHRWAACTLLDRPMKILNIHDTAQNILSGLSTFRGVFNLALGQRNV